jgi:hypothetical protein
MAGAVKKEPLKKMIIPKIYIEQNSSRHDTALQTASEWRFSMQIHNANPYFKTLSMSLH